MSTESMAGIIVVVVLAALIGVIFLGDLLGQTEEETQNRALIDSEEDMMKLVLYDAMIAYGCSVGGQLDDTDGDKYWGDWQSMKNLETSPEGEVDFEPLNKSMPRKFEGLPCYGTGATLPGTGNLGQEIGPYSKEWRDDQEGIYSRIRFKINGSFDLPNCFVHYTQDTLPTGSTSDMYEVNAPNQVTNSWFLVTEEDEESAFHRGGAGVGSGSLGMEDIDCEEIANPGSTEDSGYGPIMTLTVIDDHTGGLPHPSGSSQSPNGNIGDAVGVDFFQPDPSHVQGHEFPEGTTGYVQTNVGCDSNYPPIYSPQNTPGSSELEATGDICANTMHPYIMVTQIP